MRFPVAAQDCRQESRSKHQNIGNNADSFSGRRIFRQFFRGIARTKAVFSVAASVDRPDSPLDADESEVNRPRWVIHFWDEGRFRSDSLEKCSRKRGESPRLGRLNLWISRNHAQKRQMLTYSKGNIAAPPGAFREYSITNPLFLREK